MLIRSEEPRDYEDVFKLNFKAFGERDDESRLIERIRASSNFIPELSLVAEVDEQIVGHALFSKAIVLDNDKSHDVIVLAPVAVRPVHQKKGIGTQIIREGLRRSKDLGYSVVLLIGHPNYYPRFGFVPANNYGFELKQFKVSDEVFMACELVQGATKTIKGELKYPKAFFEE